MSELSESFCLYLTYPLTSYIEFFADLFKRPRVTVDKAVSKFKNVFFTRRKIMKHFRKLFF